MAKGTVILSILIFIAFAFPVHADIASEAGSNMVKKGIDSFMIGVADDIINVISNNQGSNSTTPSSFSESRDIFLFKILVLDYDPFSNPAVRTTIYNSSLLFLILLIVYFYTGYGYIVLCSKWPSLAEQLDYAINDGKRFDVKKYIRKLITVCVALIIGITVIWIYLFFARVVGEMMLSPAVDAAFATSSSGIIILTMAVGALILAIFVGIALLYIHIVCAVSILLLGAWLYDIVGISDAVIAIAAKGAILVWLQPVLITVASVGILTINWISSFGDTGPGTGALGSGKALLLSLGLVILLVWIAWKMVFGSSITDKATSVMIIYGVKARNKVG